MEKIDAVLVTPDKASLESLVKNLNPDAVNLDVAVTNVSKKDFFARGKWKITLAPFTLITPIIARRKNFFWLLGGTKDTRELLKLKKFLAANGAEEEKIINLDVPSQLSGTWLANVRHVEKFGADFFATGDEHMRDNLNLNFLPCVHEEKIFNRGGAILADDFQDLRQSYLTAKHIFAHVKRGTIKFALIGLTPDSFLYDNSKDFVNCSKNLQYLSLTNSAEENPWQNLFGDKLTKKLPQADLNFDGKKKSTPENFSAKSITDWEDDKIFSAEFVEENIQILKAYIELCRDNDAEPVGVIFPVAPAARKFFNSELLSNFRETIHQLEENDDFVCADMFELNFGYNYFCDMTRLNEGGRKVANIFLALNLCKNKLIPVESFCDMTYEYLNSLSNITSEDEYNALMEQVFEASAQLIRRKEKIKVAFVLYDSSMWCGDELYNFFANDSRFEPKVFLCLRHVVNDEHVTRDFLKGSELLKSHGLNVVDVKNLYAALPTQDVVILLTPYASRVATAFRPEQMTAKTLLTHIPYSFDISLRSDKYYNLTIFRAGWKIFFSSVIGREVYANHNPAMRPRSFFSGYPRTDIFFNKISKFAFDWKMTRPDAKKIIWAPHHSVTEDTIKYSTFRWNYEFMYEFAKAHPEISWVVKPHPNLSFRTVQGKIFPSVEAFEKYLQKWNDLPNAKVYTGAYYQALFATSDGMIHDSGSFIAEYQFVDKPMIFLTRKESLFNDLGNTILKEASYLVDGKDLDAIAATIQKVFIEGNDDKAAARKEVFEKYLNYPKYNGLVASEFIYKSIADELTKD